MIKVSRGACQYPSSSSDYEYVWTKSTLPSYYGVLVYLFRAWSRIAQGRFRLSFGFAPERKVSRKLGSSRSWREMSCMFELGLRSAEIVVNIEWGEYWCLNDICIVQIEPNISSAAVNIGGCPKPCLLASLLSYYCTSSDLLLVLVLQSRSAERL